MNFGWPWPNAEISQKVVNGVYCYCYVACILESCNYYITIAIHHVYTAAQLV